MSYVAPIMALVTSLLSLLLDPWHEFKRNNYFNNSWHVTWSLLLMLSGGALAFFMVRNEVEQKGLGGRYIYMLFVLHIEYAWSEFHGLQKKLIHLHAFHVAY